MSNSVIYRSQPFNTHERGMQSYKYVALKGCAHFSRHNMIVCGNPAS